MSYRLAAALRFGITVTAVNLIALALFGPGTFATSASFSVISSLYFLDYDGGFRERFGAYSMATLVAFLGMGVGILVQGHIVVIVVAAFVIGFGFAAARAFRGFIARSFIGAQLAFVLAVFTSDAPSHAHELLGGWLLGAILSLFAALTVFPRHHSGVLRSALSAWALAAADYIRTDIANRSVAAENVKLYRDKLDEIDRGDMIAGLWSPRTRALSAMTLQVHEVTGMLDFIPPTVEQEQSQKDLATASSQALENAAAMVLLGAQPREFSSLMKLRDADFDAARQAYSRTRDTAAVSDRLNLRVFSIAAESMEVLSAASQGWKHPQWPLIIEPEHSFMSILKRAFSADSVWFFHGLRTGFALAMSILIATLLGLEHGVWVVMTTLSVISISFSTSASSKTSLGAVWGMLIGVSFSVGLVFINPPMTVFAVVVFLLAIAAKWLLPTNMFLAQLSYTPFAVANATLLGWPEQRGINIERVEDILVGVVVGVVATFLTFPFGMRKLLERSWKRARQDSLVALGELQNSQQTGKPVDPVVINEQALSFASATDAVDTVFAGSVKLGPELKLVVERQRWLNLAMLLQMGVQHLEDVRAQLPAGDPGIAVIETWTTTAFDDLKKAEPPASVIT